MDKTDLPQWAVERARELAALWNDPGQEDAIARAFAPLVEENADLRALVKKLTERGKMDGERIGQLEGNLAPLVEALEPFALIAEYDIGADESDGDDYRPMQRHNVAPRVTVGHLRQARAALKAMEGE